MFIKPLVLATLSVAALSAAPPASAITRCGGSSHYGVGDGYAWRTTASGRPMDPYANITAHRSLPFGTKLQVTNQANGKSVVVTVLDRGPYVSGRILDLSYGAFSKIASPSSGVANVCYTRIA